MKVLREGEKYQVTCGHCKAILGFESVDVKLINTAVGYAGETFEPEYIVECGSCKEDVNVSRLIGPNLKDSLCDEYRRKR